METRKTRLRAIIDEEYSSTMSAEGTTADGSAEPNLSAVKNHVEVIHSQIREKMKDCKKLENERKILEFHK